MFLCASVRHRTAFRLAAVGSSGRRWCGGLPGQADDPSFVVVETDGGLLLRLRQTTCRSLNLGDLINCEVVLNRIRSNAVVVAKPLQRSVCLAGVTLDDVVASSSVEAADDVSAKAVVESPITSLSTLAETIIKTMHRSHWQGYEARVPVATVCEIHATPDGELVARSMTQEITLMSVASAELDRMHASHVLRVVGAWAPRDDAPNHFLRFVYVVPAAPTLHGSRGTVVRRAIEELTKALTERFPTQGTVWVSWPPSPLYCFERCRAIAQLDTAKLTSTVAQHNTRLWTLGAFQSLSRLPCSVPDANGVLEAVAYGDWPAALTRFQRSPRRDSSASRISVAEVVALSFLLSAVQARDLWSLPATPAVWARALTLTAGDSLDVSSCTAAVISTGTQRVYRVATTAEVEDRLELEAFRVDDEAAAMRSSATDSSASGLKAVAIRVAGTDALTHAQRSAISESIAMLYVDDELEPVPVDQLPVSIERSTPPDALLSLSPPSPRQLRGLATHLVEHSRTLGGAENSTALLVAALLRRLCVAFAPLMDPSTVTSTGDACVALEALLPFGGVEPTDTSAIVDAVATDDFEPALKQFDVNARAAVACLAIEVTCAASEAARGQHAREVNSAVAAFEQGFGMAVPQHVWPSLVSAHGSDWEAALRMTHTALRRRQIKMHPVLLHRLATVVPPGHMLRMAASKLPSVRDDKAMEVVRSLVDVTTVLEHDNQAEAIAEVHRDSTYFVPPTFVAGVLASDN